mmetsp:Transcript_11128/g.20127  ORF Transcript_11128/g.20127 Transcript_11128/m.20127 type:complete len:415 (-) Transcript_11128:1134-2378(-)
MMEAVLLVFFTGVFVGVFAGFFAGVFAGVFTGVSICGLSAEVVAFEGVALEGVEGLRAALGAFDLIGVLSATTDFGGAAAFEAVRKLGVLKRAEVAAEVAAVVAAVVAAATLGSAMAFEADDGFTCVLRVEGRGFAALLREEGGAFCGVPSGGGGCFFEGVKIMGRGVEGGAIDLRDETGVVMVEALGVEATAAEELEGVADIGVEVIGAELLNEVATSAEESEAFIGVIDKEEETRGVEGFEFCFFAFFLDESGVVGSRSFDLEDDTDGVVTDTDFTEISGTVRDEATATSGVAGGSGTVGVFRVAAALGVVEVLGVAGATTAAGLEGEGARALEIGVDFEGVVADFRLKGVGASETVDPDSEEVLRTFRAESVLESVAFGDLVLEEATMADTLFALGVVLDDAASFALPLLR